LNASPNAAPSSTQVNGVAHDTNTVHAIQVFRIAEGQTVHLRTLSDSYGGCFTHYYHKRSQYCPGENCPSPVHKIDRIWKGYAAVEIYVASRKKWMPWVLEISEHLELDFRDRYARGQVWEIFRDLPQDGKKQPVTGKLQETRDPATFPAAFDVRPVLLHLYHVFSVDLNIKNPMPPRLIVRESDGEAPKALQPGPTGHEAAQEAQKAQEMLSEYVKKLKTPTERKPGKR
jgi:hypothetical protein